MVLYPGDDSTALGYIKMKNKGAMKSDIPRIEEIKEDKTEGKQGSKVEE